MKLLDSLDKKITRKTGRYVIAGNIIGTTLHGGNIDSEPKTKSATMIQ